MNQKAANDNDGIGHKTVVASRNSAVKKRKSENDQEVNGDY